MAEGLDERAGEPPEHFERGTLQATAQDLGEAVQRCEFALVIWNPANGRIGLANDAAAQLADLTLQALVGQSVFEFVTPRDHAERVATDLKVGVLDLYEARHRFVVTHRPEPVPVRVWTRAIEVDGRRGAVTIVATDDVVGCLGRDPGRPWVELANVVVGTLDPTWRIRAVSAEAFSATGYEPTELPGLSLLDLLAPADAGRVGVTAGPPTEPTTFHDVQVAHRDGHWITGCLILAPSSGDPGATAFAFLTPSAKVETGRHDRLTSLELRLRRIGAEVRAAGLLEEMSQGPSLTAFPQLAELTTRQWEIVSRLLRGERVKGIAAEMYLSESTIRNHLSAIFAKFGVHSQAELLARLRQPAGSESGRPPRSDIGR